jgi:hypothetical protein
MTSIDFGAQRLIRATGRRPFILGNEMVVGLLAWQQKSENSRISQNLAARNLALSWFGACPRNRFARHMSWFTPTAFNQLRVA